MNRRSTLAVLFAFPTVLAAQKKRSTDRNQPEIELMDVRAAVESGRVEIDGRVKNTSDKPVRKLAIFFEMLDSDRKVLTRQQGAIEEPVLDPSAEASFSGQVAWHARAVAYRLSFEDGSGRELRGLNTGPFAIE